MTGGFGHFRSFTICHATGELEYLSQETAAKLSFQWSDDDSVIVCGHEAAPITASMNKTRRAM